MAGIPRTSASFLYLFFVYSPSPCRGTYRNENTEIIAAEINIFLCFIFVFLLSHSAWLCCCKKKTSSWYVRYGTILSTVSTVSTVSIYLYIYSTVYNVQCTVSSIQKTTVSHDSCGPTTNRAILYSFLQKHAQKSRRRGSPLPTAEHDMTCPNGYTLHTTHYTLRAVSKSQYFNASLNVLTRVLSRFMLRSTTSALLLLLHV